MLALASAATAQTTAAEPSAKTELAGIGFLIGSWTSGARTVAGTHETARGSSVFTTEVGGSVLLRRDHTELFDTDGKPSGAFDQIMLVYPEAGDLHADYADGEHVIHYTSAQVVSGKSVAFSTTPQAARPTFRLLYEAASANTLNVRFESAPPGRTEFHPIVTGTLSKGS